MSEGARGPGAKRAASLSRREVLGLLGGAGAAAVLAACGGQGALAPPTAPPTRAAGGGASTAGPTRAATVATTARPIGASGSPTAATAAPAAGSATATINIPATGAKLPTEQVTFRWVDAAQAKTAFLKEYAAAYQGAHPNITIAFDYLPPTELARVVPIGVQNGNAHDIFQLPLGLSLGQVVREGWVAPLDDVVPDFARWKAAFPPGSFSEGITTFGGKTYTFPLLTGKFYSTLLLYNVEYLQRAGYDPAAAPLTWDEFRAAARKVTEQGKGQYYGFVIGGNQTNSWEFVGNLAEMAGAAGGAIDWRTGEYNYASDQHLAAIDLLLALKADGSIFPGSLALSIPDARARMPQGVAGMILHQSANVPIWSKENPDFAFDLASQPVPNSGTPLPLGYTSDFPAPWGLYAKSPHKAIAGDIFAYLGSEAGQIAFQVVSGGGLPVAFPRANQAANLDPRSKRAFALYERQLRLHPQPVVRNTDVAQVNLERKTIKPNFGETVQGIFTGQLRDPKRAMQELVEREEKELERAIKAARDKGAKVSRDDWKFPNWDPTRDYTQEDYQALTNP